MTLLIQKHGIILLIILLKSLYVPISHIISFSIFQHSAICLHFTDSVAKAFSIAPDGMGRYTCDECGKIFKHPGSLQHHRHIHRGTHRCPSCGKAFSRRWDMERHLNKSKYGCPANRFSIGSTGSNNSNTSIGSGSPVAVALATTGSVSGGQTSVTVAGPIGK